MKSWMKMVEWGWEDICLLYFFKLKFGLSYRINDDHLYGFRVWKFPFQPEIIFFYFFRCVLLSTFSALHKGSLIHVQRCADHFANMKFHRVWAAVIKTHWKKYFHGHKTPIIFEKCGTQNNMGSLEWALTDDNNGWINTRYMYFIFFTRCNYALMLTLYDEGDEHEFIVSS